MNLTLIYDAVLTLAYPQVCAICGRSVEQRRFGVACEACWRETRIFADDEWICWKCGAPGPACGRCEEMAFTAARAAGMYEGALRESVLLLKRQPYVAQEVESLIAAAARRDPPSSVRSTLNGRCSPPGHREPFRAIAPLCAAVTNCTAAGADRCMSLGRLCPHAHSKPLAVDLSGLVRHPRGAPGGFADGRQARARLALGRGEG